jgi:hypothetical protein
MPLDWSDCVPGPHQSRLLIKLKPGEPQPHYEFTPIPEGYRLESDQKLRARILAQIQQRR